MDDESIFWLLQGCLTMYNLHDCRLTRRFYGLVWNQKVIRGSLEPIMLFECLVHCEDCGSDSGDSLPLEIFDYRCNEHSFVILHFSVCFVLRNCVVKLFFHSAIDCEYSHVWPFFLDNNVFEGQKE